MGVFDKSASVTCPPPPISADIKAEAVAGSLTFHKIIIIIGWICVVITLCLWLGLTIPHLRRYRAPDEQRQILRIVFTPVVFAITAIISIHAYGAAEYLTPLASLYEAFALASLFLLYTNYVTPESHTRNEYFHNLENKAKKGKIIPGGSLRWFRTIWRTVFLYCLLYTILVIIQEATQATGVYCATSLRPKFAHIWLQVFELATTIWAITAVIRFCRRLQVQMAGHKPIGKLISFKLFIVVNTLQRFIFSMLDSRVTGSAKVTYRDITIGLPALLVCVEGILFTIGFYFTFRSSTSHVGKEDPASSYGIGRALVDALNPVDLFRGITLSFAYLRHGRSK